MVPSNLQVTGSYYYHKVISSHYNLNIMDLISGTLFSALWNSNFPASSKRTPPHIVQSQNILMGSSTVGVGLVLKSWTYMFTKIFWSNLPLHLSHKTVF